MLIQGGPKKLDHFWKYVTPVCDDIGRHSVHQNVQLFIQCKMDILNDVIFNHSLPKFREMMPHRKYHFFGPSWICCVGNLVAFQSKERIFFLLLQMVLIFLQYWFKYQLYFGLAFLISDTSPLLYSSDKRTGIRYLICYHDTKFNWLPLPRTLCNARHLSFCLSVSLLATVCKKYWMDLVPVDKKEVIKF